MASSAYPREFVWGRNHRDRLNLARSVRDQLQRANTSAAITQIANMRLLDKIFGVERGKCSNISSKYPGFDQFRVSDEAHYVQLLGILQFFAVNPARLLCPGCINTSRLIAPVPYGSFPEFGRNASQVTSPFIPQFIPRRGRM